MSCWAGVISDSLVRPSTAASGARSAVAMAAAGRAPGAERGARARRGRGAGAARIPARGAAGRGAQASAGAARGRLRRQRRGQRPRAARASRARRAPVPVAAERAVASPRPWVSPGRGGAARGGRTGEVITEDAPRGWRKPVFQPRIEVDAAPLSPNAEGCAGLPERPSCPPPPVPGAPPPGGAPCYRQGAPADGDTAGEAGRPLAVDCVVGFADRAGSASGRPALLLPSPLCALAGARRMGRRRRRAAWRRARRAAAATPLPRVASPAWGACSCARRGRRARARAAAERVAAGWRARPAHGRDGRMGGCGPTTMLLRLPRACRGASPARARPAAWRRGGGGPPRARPQLARWPRGLPGARRWPLAPCGPRAAAALVPQ
jgi:hypothetical protein